MKIRTICVYCGSSPGKNPEYSLAAASLARELCKRNIGLVYGGGAVGVMGAVANAVLEAGGEVIGVIPKSLALKEVAHDNLSELHVVDTMHKRKAMMASLADGFIAMPGGFGTLEELIEILTWAQLGLIQKPIGILNIEHFYDHLIAQLDHMVDQELLKSQNRDLLMVDQQASQLIDKMDRYEPRTVEKWIGPKQT